MTILKLNICFSLLNKEFLLYFFLFFIQSQRFPITYSSITDWEVDFILDGNNYWFGKIISLAHMFWKKRFISSSAEQFVKLNNVKD